MRIRVDLQHLGAHHVDDGQTAVPECLLGGLHQEWLERVGDFIAHVRVGQVEAGQEHGLQLVLRGHLGGHHVAAEHVDENHVGGCDEALVLPALEQQRTIHAAQPKHWVGGGEVLEPVASPAQELPQTPQQLAGGGLDDHPLGSSGYSVGVRKRCLLNRGNCVVGIFGALVGWTRLVLGEGGEVRTRLRLLEVLIVEVRNIVLVGGVRLHLLGALFLGRHGYYSFPWQHVDERVSLQVLVFGVLAVLDGCVVAHRSWAVLKQGSLTVTWRKRKHGSHGARRG